MGNKLAQCNLHPQYKYHRSLKSHSRASLVLHVLLQPKWVRILSIKHEKKKKERQRWGAPSDQNKQSYLGICTPTRYCFPLSNFLQKNINHTCWKKKKSMYIFTIMHIRQNNVASIANMKYSHWFDVHQKSMSTRHRQQIKTLLVKSEKHL